MGLKLIHIYTGIQKKILNIVREQHLRLLT